MLKSKSSLFGLKPKNVSQNNALTKPIKKTLNQSNKKKPLFKPTSFKPAMFNPLQANGVAPVTSSLHNSNSPNSNSKNFTKKPKIRKQAAAQLTAYLVIQGFSKKIGIAILKSRFALAAVILLVCMQLFISSVHTVANAIGIFPVTKVIVNGDISAFHKKAILESPAITTITNKRQSMLLVDAEILAEKIKNSNSITQQLQYKISKNYPFTLVLTASEQNNIILLRTAGKTTAHLLSGGQLNNEKLLPNKNSGAKENSPSSANWANFNYNYFTLEVKLNKNPGLEEEVAGQLMLVLQRAIKGIPESEQDFLNMFSNLHFSSGVFTLYPIGEKKISPPQIFWRGQLSTKKLREARYAFLYYRTRGDSRRWNAIDITSKLTRFTFINPKLVSPEPIKPKPISQKAIDNALQGKPYNNALSSSTLSLR